MQLAITFSRELVIREMLRMGFGIDQFEDRIGDGSTVTPAGFAISVDNVTMLALLHQLGANMSVVAREEDSSFPRSAVMLAMIKPSCLAYLLDEVNPVRPVVFDDDTLHMLCSCARVGSPVVPILELIKARGFDFSALDGIRVEPDKDGAFILPAEAASNGGAASFTDVLLLSAQRSGNRALVRYIVEDLGVSSETGKLEIANDLTPEFSSSSCFPSVPEARQGKVLEKYKCTACDAVSAMKRCSRCKVVRYCTVECQSWHWSEGGHKEECNAPQ